MAASPEIARENGKKGGRPRGSKGKKTLEKQAALEHFQERVRKSVDPLFESQMTIARGCSYLYRIERTGKGKDVKEKHVLVTDPDTIAAYLDGDFDGGDDDGNFYYITTERPDNKAIDSLLDRTFGKAHQSVSMEGPGSITPDDVRTLIGALPASERKEYYAFLARLIEKSKRPGKPGKGASRKR